MVLKALSDVVMWNYNIYLSQAVAVQVHKELFRTIPQSISLGDTKQAMPMNASTAKFTYNTCYMIMIV